MARLRETDLLQAIEAQIRNRYADYLAFQQLTDLQQVNLNVAREQAALARELYRFRTNTNFEVEKPFTGDPGPGSVGKRSSGSNKPKSACWISPGFRCTAEDSNLFLKPW
ncbi:MAG: hypothetical protein IPI11_08045 [Haliscomenobacter sp.]|nr:hypothetical protein [Haliscomenobacter sp.]